MSDNAGRVRSFEHIKDERTILLTTFRKDGRGVATPIWPIVRDGVVSVLTGATSAKMKRVANNSRVTLAACNNSGKLVHGPTYEAWARPLSDSEIKVIAAERLAKYGLLDRIVRAALWITRRKQAGLALSPVPWT